VACKAYKAVCDMNIATAAAICGFWYYTSVIMPLPLQGNFGENKHSGSRDSLSMVGADASRKRDVSPSYINKVLV